jgi:hypothetical protein
LNNEYEKANLREKKNYMHTYEILWRSLQHNLTFKINIFLGSYWEDYCLGPIEIKDGLIFWSHACQPYPFQESMENEQTKRTFWAQIYQYVTLSLL